MQCDNKVQSRSYAIHGKRRQYRNPMTCDLPLRGIPAKTHSISLACGWNSFFFLQLASNIAATEAACSIRILLEGGAKAKVYGESKPSVSASLVRDKKATADLEVSC